jgi:hypothetical protein
MTSTLGTPLSRPRVAWIWFAAAVLAAVYFAWDAITSDRTWFASVIFAGIAVLILIAPRLGKRQTETFRVDESGVVRVEGDIREQIRWADVAEIRIITTDQGPYAEDVYFALGDGKGAGCLIPHDAAVRTKLLEELHSRFPGLDDDMVVKAMGSTSNNNFLIWKRPDSKR